MRVVKKPEERRTEMIAAAARLFAQQGFVRTSVSEIASAVNVAKGLFYYYFTTKDDMVKAVIEGYCSYLGTVAEEIASGEGTTLEKLDRLMGNEMWQQIFETPLYRDLCLNQHAALYADMCDRVYEHMKPSLHIMASQVLAEAKASGHTPKASEADVDRMAAMTLYGLLMMARRGECTLKEATELVQQMILGIQSD